jgi:hypothetical protein
MAAALVQFAVLPSYGHLCFSDAADVSEPLKHILEERKKLEAGQKILATIVQQTGANTVGELRKLTDPEWLRLEIPALCRILLKYCIRQAGRLPAASNNAMAVISKTELKGAGDPFMKELQDDFNFGQAFDMSQYASRLTVLVNMGFSQNEAMEALCITDNKGVEGALEVLVTDDKVKRKKRREEAISRQGRSVNNMNTTGPNTQQGSSNTNSPSNADMDREMTALKKQADVEKQARIRSEAELKTHLSNLNRIVYKEYIRGMIADETITVQDTQQLQRYRVEKQISQQEHDQIIKELNLTAQKFDDMKKFKPKGENECIVCLDKIKDHVIFNCMHLCLCEGCATQFTTSKSSKCPVCSKKITKIMKIFSS